jgi:hypothetical protein
VVVAESNRGKEAIRSNHSSREQLCDLNVPIKVGSDGGVHHGGEGGFEATESKNSP